MAIRFELNRTSTFVVMCSLHLYFLGLSLRNTSKALFVLRDEKKITCLSRTGYRDFVPVLSIDVNEYLLSLLI